MYRCLSQQQFEANDYLLIPIREQDIEAIRVWRNEQIPILRQKIPLSPEQQHNYFHNVIVPSFKEEQPAQILFSILKNDNCIGYGGLTHIDWEARRAEVSFLLNSEIKEGSNAFKEAFFIYITLLKQIAFHHLSLHRLHTETFALRPAMALLLEELGFILEGIMRDHVFKEGRWENALIHGMLATTQNR